MFTKGSYLSEHSRNNQLCVMLFFRKFNNFLRFLCWTKSSSFSSIFVSFYFLSFVLCCSWQRWSFIQNHDDDSMRWQQKFHLVYIAKCLCFNNVNIAQSSVGEKLDFFYDYSEAIVIGENAIFRLTINWYLLVSLFFGKWRWSAPKRRHFWWKLIPAKTEEILWMKISETRLWRG